MITQSTFNEFKGSLKKNFALRIAPNGRYCQSDYWQVIFCAADRSTTIEDACRIAREQGGSGPSQDIVLDALKAFDVVELQNAWENVFDCQIRRAKASGRIPRKVVLAIDYNQRAYYGKERDSPWFVGGKPKDGTYWFTKIATASIVTNGSRFTIAMMPYCDGLRDVDVVRYLVSRARRYFPLKYVTLDKEFFNAEIMGWLDSKGVGYLIPAKQANRYREVEEGRGREDFSFDFVIGPYGRGTKTTLLYHYVDNMCLRYGTNMSITPAEGDSMYEARWGIETGYRVHSENCAWTTSNDICVRLFHRIISIALYNLWVFVNLLAGVEVIRYLHRGKKVQEKTLYTITHKALVRWFAASSSDYG